MAEPESDPASDTTVRKLRRRAHALVWSTPVQNFIIVVIIVNAIVLGLQTYPDIVARFGTAMDVIDYACLVIYLIELGLKLFGSGWAFFRSGWNIFDFLIIVITLIPASEGTAVLRALRVLRVLRLISVVPSLRRVVDGLGRAIPGIGAVGALLVILFYVGAVMATMLFGEEFPHLFGDLQGALFTLFQMMTLDNWSVVSREVMADNPGAAIFFVVFVLTSALTVLNLMVAVIVDAMQSLPAPIPEEERPAVSREIAAVQSEVVALRSEVRELTTLLREARGDETR